MIIRKCTIALAVAALAAGCSALDHGSSGSSQPQASSSASGASSQGKSSSSGQSAGGSSSSERQKGEAQQSAASGASSQGVSGSSQPQLAQSTVREIQRTLNENGFSAGNVDGIMGPKTESALRNYQQAKGLKATGRPDPQTLSALGVGRSSSSATGGSSGGGSSSGSPSGGSGQDQKQ